MLNVFIVVNFEERKKIFDNLTKLFIHLLFYSKMKKHLKQVEKVTDDWKKKYEEFLAWSDDAPEMDFANLEDHGCLTKDVGTNWSSKI